MVYFCGLGLWEGNNGSSQKHTRPGHFSYLHFPTPSFPYIFLENKHTPTHHHLLLKSSSIEKAIYYSTGCFSCSVLCTAMSWLSGTKALPVVDMPSVAEITLNQRYTYGCNGEFLLRKINWQLTEPQDVAFTPLICFRHLGMSSLARSEAHTIYHYINYSVICDILVTREPLLKK